MLKLKQAKKANQVSENKWKLKIQVDPDYFFDFSRQKRHFKCVLRGINKREIIVSYRILIEYSIM